MRGSSPQVRGKPAIDALKKPPMRLIPAGAGKTAVPFAASACAAAHPRRCGENFRSKIWVIVVVGSSPQVRGKLKRVFLNL